MRCKSENERVTDNKGGGEQVCNQSGVPYNIIHSKVNNGPQALGIPFRYPFCKCGGVLLEHFMFSLAVCCVVNFFTKPMGSWLQRIYGCCTSADWCWWPSSRKYNPAAASGRDDADDDALIEATSSFDANNGIAILSRGKIKYVKSGSVNHTGSTHIGIPIIDPLIGQDYNSSRPDRHNHHHQQRQLFAQLHQHARLLVNKNIFHWHQQTHHQHQWWWDSSTPPSSVDLEWEHEGLMPPVVESASEEGDRDHDDVDLYDTADEGEETGADRTTTGRIIPSSDRNDSIVHRSPSPASACHSLEWDSNGDDFFGHDCRPTPNIKSFSS